MPVGLLNLMTFAMGGIPHAGSRQIPAFLSHLKRRWSQLESWEELQGSCHHSKRPRCLSPVQIHLIPLHWLDYHAEYRLKTWWPLWQPCGTSRESHRCLSQHESTSFAAYFGTPKPPNRELKGRLEGHLLLLKRVPNFLVFVFPLKFWFKCPISASFGGWAYNGPLYSTPLLS